MLLFRSEEAIDRWCARRQTVRGESLSVEQVWALAQRWYHNRLSPEYHGRTTAEVAALFQALGLVSSFWQPG